MRGLDRDTLPMLAVHLLPLLGVWLAGWDAGNLLILYWLESAVIGLWTIVLVAAAPNQPLKILSNPGQPAITGGGMALFILVHAGFFMGIHLYFLHFAFEVTQADEHGSLTAAIMHMVVDDGLWLPLAGLFVVRMLVTVQALQRQEPVQRQIIGFYFRIVVMQLAIILGGFLMFMIGPVAALITLVAVRLGFEIAVPGVEDYVEREMEKANRAG
jgi:hypothetical protein